MNGVLLRWEGYITGWREKYFVLRDGVIECFPDKEFTNSAEPQHDPGNDDEEEVECITISLCEINPDPHVSTQFELRARLSGVLWFLKAKTPKERKLWIRALGSAKICPHGLPFSITSNTRNGSNRSFLRFNGSPMKTTALVSSSIGSQSISSGSEENDSVLSSTDNSLPLIEDVTSCGSSADFPTYRNGNDHEDHHHDIPSADVISICSISDVVQMTEVRYAKDQDEVAVHQPQFNKQLSNGHQKPQSCYKTLLTQCKTAKNKISHLEASISCNNESSNVLDNLNQLDAVLVALRSRIMEVKIEQFGETPGYDEPSNHGYDESNTNDDVTGDNVITNNVPQNTAKEDSEDIVPNFFTTRRVDFGALKAQIKTVDGRNRIPLQAFMTACVDYTHFFDRLGTSSLMGTIKGDINGNIEKIKKNCAQDAYKNIEFVLDLVDLEHTLKADKGPDTTTQALLWLTRALRTMACYLHNLFSDESQHKGNSVDSFIAAYEQVLMQHHNWIVQRLFKVGLGMVPSADVFTRSMLEDPDTVEYTERVKEQVIAAGVKYSSDMVQVTDIIKEYYAAKNMVI